MSLTDNDENVFQALLGICGHTPALDSDESNNFGNSFTDNAYIVVGGSESTADADLIEREKQAIKLVEQDGDTRHAIILLKGIIKDYPSHASAHNNLAQVYRIILQDENLDKSQCDRIYVKIMAALETCMKICEPESIDKNNKIVRVSEKHHVGLLNSCHTQMSLVYMEMAKRFKNSSDKENYSDEIWNLEAQASRQLELAGLYGNEIAKKLSVFKNPYAQLCGNMVRKSLANEFSAYDEEWADLDIP